MPKNPQRDNNPSQSTDFLSDVLRSNAALRPTSPALRFKGETYSYGDLAELVSRLGTALRNLGVAKWARVAVYLPNCPEVVVSAFATFELGGFFVPINPLYRPRQALHVLADCGASVLITTRYLFATIIDKHADLRNLETIIFVDAIDDHGPTGLRCRTFDWQDLAAESSGEVFQPLTSVSLSDPAVIFYTSGSTGRAKGVTISHQNLIDGARIVSSYLENSSDDRVLAALPLSFDYGFSQATTMVYVGGELVLTNYTLPQTLLTQLEQSRATGLAGVPTMWAQLANLNWPREIAVHLRYVTNSGGRLPRSVTSGLRRQIPKAHVFLMYGLTEAFRSTYLDPAFVDKYPDSIGKAVPGVDIHVVRPDGSLCEPNEPGELVHAGALVTLGYWNNVKATKLRFRPFDSTFGQADSLNLAVWSGDIVTRDEDGFLFFVERADSTIKSSGYRVSPTEIEETIFDSGLVSQVAALGIPDDVIGHRIGLAVVPTSVHEETDFAIRHVCARELPPYMQPDEILVLEEMVLTANGKPDRTALAKMFRSRRNVQDT